MMKRPFGALAVTVLMVGLGAAAHASSYQFKVPLKGIAPPANWQAYEPLYSDWENISNVFGCSNWAPAPSTVAVGQTFTQTATDCQQDQARTVQPRERDTRSGSIRNVGEPFTETRTLTASATRDAVGTRETWSAITPAYTDWANSGSVYGCTNWSPSEMTVAVGQVFIQTATDCKQDQTRTRQDREQEATTKAIRNVGSPVTETQTIAASSTRSATGTKESWSAAEAIYSVWKNSGEPYGCTNWSPAPSTVTVGQKFTQTRSCSQNQTRTRQDREYEPTLGQYRNVGSPVTETQTLTVSENQQAVGTKETWVAYEPLYGTWTNSGGVYSCSAWSPDPATVDAGQAFTQTRTCKQDQTRTVQPRERETTLGTIRNAGAATTGTQTVTVPQSQQATGTKSVCKYSSNTTWKLDTCNFALWVKWNGKEVYQHYWAPDTTSVSVGGLLYKRGAQKKSGYFAEYEVCVSKL